MVSSSQDPDIRVGLPMMYLSTRSQGRDAVRRRGLGREKFPPSKATGGWGPIWGSACFTQSPICLWFPRAGEREEEGRREGDRIPHGRGSRRPRVWDVTPETGQDASYLHFGGHGGEWLFSGQRSLPNLSTSWCFGFHSPWEWNSSAMDTAYWPH